MTQIAHTRTKSSSFTFYGGFCRIRFKIWTLSASGDCIYRPIFCRNSAEAQKSHTHVTQRFEQPFRCFKHCIGFLPCLLMKVKRQRPDIHFVCGRLNGSSSSRPALCCWHQRRSARGELGGEFTSQSRRTSKYQVLRIKWLNINIKDQMSKSKY